MFMQTRKICETAECYLMAALGGWGGMRVSHCYLYHVEKLSRAETAAKVTALVLVMPTQFKAVRKKIQIHNKYTFRQKKTLSRSQCVF